MDGGLAAVGPREKTRGKMPQNLGGSNFLLGSWAENMEKYEK